jgi:alpha-1,2-mannosyltransferase
MCPLPCRRDLPLDGFYLFFYLHGLQAAGLIPVAHESGGPLKDIIVPYKDQRTGYHATTAESFAEALHNALSLSSGEDKAIRERARESAVKRFSEEEFVKGWDLSGWKEWV